MWRRSDNLFRDITFSSHSSLEQKSFIWSLLAAFSSTYILAFFWISFRDNGKFFDLCKVIHFNSISSKSISLIFLPPPFSFFAKLLRFFDLTLFCIYSHFMSILLSFFYQPRISAYLSQLITFLHFLFSAVSRIKYMI